MTTSSTSDRDATPSPSPTSETGRRADESKEQSALYMEQYKLFVQMADQVSERRLKANTFYTTLHVSFYGAMWVLLVRELGSIRTASFAELSLLTLPFLLLGVICLCWWFNIRSYDQLNGQKFVILHEMERNLPEQPWTKEWTLLGEGKEYWQAYYPLSRLERWVPLVMGVFDLSTAMIIIQMLRGS